MIGTKLVRADFSGSVLVGVDLTGADLRDAILIDADLTNANLSKANLTGAQLRGVKGLSSARRPDTLGLAKPWGRRIPFETAPEDRPPEIQPRLYEFHFTPPSYDASMQGPGLPLPGVATSSWPKRSRLR